MDSLWLFCLLVVCVSFITEIQHENKTKQIWSIIIITIFENKYIMGKFPRKLIYEKISDNYIWMMIEKEKTILENSRFRSVSRRKEKNVNQKTIRTLHI